MKNQIMHMLLNTKSFEKILDDVEARLKGDAKKASFLNITTQFGGGKTHTLIGLLHRANEWGAKVVVLDGRELDANKQTLWGEIERQLDGKIDKLDGYLSMYDDISLNPDIRDDKDKMKDERMDPFRELELENLDLEKMKLNLTK